MKVILLSVNVLILALLVVDVSNWNLCK